MMDRLASETGEEREARLQQMRDRLASETRTPTMPTFQLLSSPAPLSGWLSRRLSGGLCKNDSLISNNVSPYGVMAGAADFVALRRLLSLSGTISNIFRCMEMVDLPDTLVFATLPSTQRCASGHYRQAGSMSASTHMMPSSFSC